MSRRHPWWLLRSVRARLRSNGPAIEAHHVGIGGILPIDPANKVSRVSGTNQFHTKSFFCRHLRRLGFGMQLLRKNFGSQIDDSENGQSNYPVVDAKYSSSEQSCH